MKKAFLLLLLSAAAQAQSPSGLEPQLSDFTNKKHLSVVFASHNIKKPGSMFGHVFIVAHDEDFPEPDATTLEFLGTAESTGGYAMALFTGIPGRYFLKSFFEKRKAYDLEDRDLWIYPYTGDADDRRAVLKTVAELLNDRQATYNFFRSNCSTAAYQALTKKKSHLPYALPVSTLAWLQSEDLIGPPVLYPSSLRRALASLDELDPVQQVEVTQALAGAKPDNQALPARSAGAANLALNYLLPREAEPQVRGRLFMLKKQIVTSERLEPGLQAPPSPDLGSFGEALTLAKGANNYAVEFHPAQRDFFTSSRDGHETALLELLKIRLEFIDSSFKVSDLTLFRLDSHLGSTPYSHSFNRLIEVGYVDWAKQRVERFGEIYGHVGWGYSVRFGPLTLGATPLVGVTHGLGLRPYGFDLGARALANLWLGSRFALQGSFKRRWNVDARVARDWEGAAILILNSNFRLGFAFSHPSKDFENTEVRAIITF